MDETELDDVHAAIFYEWKLQSLLYKRIAVVSDSYSEEIKRHSKYNCSRIMILQSNDLLGRPKSRFDYTLFDLTLELTPPHDVFHRATFRVHSSNDLLGVELGGALKNVIAIGFCDNTKAALVTRAIVEMRKLGVACGAQAPIRPPPCRRFNFLSLEKPVSNCLNSSDLDYSEKYIKLRRCSSQDMIIIFHL